MGVEQACTALDAVKDDTGAFAHGMNDAVAAENMTADGRRHEIIGRI